MNVNIDKVEIFTTVPVGYVEEVRNAACEAGAGIVGDYTYCSSSIKSVGTFKANGDANPYVGDKNDLVFVDEERLEFVCGIDLVDRAIKAIRRVHPYEEPIIGVIPLLDEAAFQQKP